MKLNTIIVAVVILAVGYFLGTTYPQLAATVKAKTGL